MSAQPEVMDAKSDELVWKSSTDVLVIKDEAQYLTSGERLQLLVGFKKRVAEFFAPMKKKAWDSHKEICNKETDTLKPAEDEEQVIRQARTVFRQEQTRIAEEQARRDAEEAREREETRLLEEAAALEREGLATDNPELILDAEDLASAPVQTPTIIPARAVPAQKGLAERPRKWRFRIRNANIVPREYLMVDEKAVQKVVDALKQRCKIAGIDVYSEDGGEAVRGR